MFACRNVINSLWVSRDVPHGSNAALVRDRYLRSLDKATVEKNDRLDLQKLMIKSGENGAQLYHCAYKRFLCLLDPDCEYYRIFQTQGRIIVGLGAKNALETGISLHHTFGVPFIPGSALKGLAYHYCDQVWGGKEDGFKKEGRNHKIIFGTSEDSGHIRFLDAWITPDTQRNSIRPDVMTPHHGDYYKGKSAPTDFDDPNPVTFLSVSGKFLVPVSCDIPGDKGKKWAELSLALISNALRDWGIGGKTSSGYGRLVE